MTGTTITIDSGTVALIGLALNAIATIYAVLVRIARVELKTDTMWDFLLKGALVEAQQKGIVKAHSPIRPSRDVIQQFGELGRQIRKWYVENNLKKKTNSELSLLLVTKYGTELVEQVCLPYDLNLGAALIAAVQFCREEDEHV